MRRINDTDENAVGLRWEMRRGQLIRVIAAGLFAVLLLGLPATADHSPKRANAEIDAPKAYWQERYRSLLREADQLRATIETERELYADANRRNYRRGSKRHGHRLKVHEAQDQLEVVLAELAALPDEARRAGALPGWFYEVESERASPANASDADLEEEEETGRNPLYSDEHG